MACGTPVIAFESGGVKEIISNDNGILVEKENIEKMEDNIRHLKKNYSLFKKFPFLNTMKCSIQNPRNITRFAYPDTGGDTFGDTNGNVCFRKN